MKDRLERFVILPFTAGCISESSIPVVPTQHTRRSKQGSNSAPTEEKKDGEEGCLVDEESLSGQNSKTNLPKFQKLFKNFKNLSQIFVDKDELEREMGMEIGFPTDVKHVTHIGWDSCDNSIFSKGWNDLAAQDLIDLHSSQLGLAIKAQAETSKITSFLETKYHFNNAIAQ